jgi:hypothetical protein
MNPNPRPTTTLAVETRRKQLPGLGCRCRLRLTTKVDAMLTSRARRVVELDRRVQRCQREDLARDKGVPGCSRFGECARIALRGVPGQRDSAGQSCRWSRMEV